MLTTCHDLLLTGISFFTECRNLNFGKIGSPYVVKSKTISERLGLDHAVLSNSELKQIYPYLTIGTGNEGVLQLSQCGIVNPRKLVMAQKKAARSRGCVIVSSVVDRITKAYDPVCRRTLHQVVTEDGRIIKSQKILLCTGGFSLAIPLLPARLLPDITLAATQTLKIELCAADATSLQGMPTLASMTRDDNLADCYMCPPLVYPDGNINFLNMAFFRLSLQYKVDLTD